MGCMTCPCGRTIDLDWYLEDWDEEAGTCIRCVEYEEKLEAVKHSGSQKDMTAFLKVRKEVRMSKVAFHEGQELAGILTTGDYLDIFAGSDECESIVVVMESGQMSGVPWAVVTFETGRIEKYNLALIEAVVVRR